MEQRTEFLGFVRANGQVGVREHLLALPSVVCATKAVRQAATFIPNAVSIEHPIGCAQIGKDRDQTLRILVGIGSHPNVRDTVVIGLGCEGIPAKEVYHGISQHQHTAHVVTIQTVGGTQQAAQSAIAYLAHEKSGPEVRQSVSVDQLILGVGTIDGLGSQGHQLMEAFMSRGGRVIEAKPEGPYILHYGSHIPAGIQYAAMAAPIGNSDSTLVTGLAAAGAQIIIAQADMHHMGGNPVVPVIRIGYQPKWRQALMDDMDGMIEDRNPDAWVDWILEVASGVPTMVETMHAETFAIERIGPTL